MCTSRTIALSTDVPADPPDLSRPHFVGIGGMAMSGLALICAAQGARVTGSDSDPDAARLAELTTAGCQVSAGHDDPPPADATCVVWSTAISDGNPELAAARAAGIQVIHRAQAMQALAEDRTFLAVSGTHGKSTVTGMITTILDELGEDPTYAIGAALAGDGSSARLGCGPVLVAEADESDRSFLWLHPQIAVITNVTDDHPENYYGIKDHILTHCRFVDGIARDGTLVVNVEDPGAGTVADLVRSTRPDLRVVTVGTAPGDDWRITATRTSGMSTVTVVTAPDGRQLTVSVSVPGRHMAHNAVAAVAAAVAAGTPTRKAVQAISGFAGVRGRLTQRGHQNGVRVIDSFAHHPLEIRADITAARDIARTGGQVIVVYQPRGYNRTRQYAVPMAAELAAADLVLLLDICAPAWEPMPGSGVSSQLIADDGTGEVVSPQDAVSRVASAARPGDIVLVMGSGPVAGQVCAALADPQPARF